VTVTINGAQATVDAMGAFSDTATLATGANTITVVATDAPGNQIVDVRTVYLDMDNPVLTVTAPADSLITSDTTVTVSGSVTDVSAVTVDANGVPLPVDGAGMFTGSIALMEGANLVTVTATDAATNFSQIVRVVTSDTQPPVLTVTSPTDGSTVTTDSVAVTGTVSDVTDVALSLNGASVPVDSTGAFDTTIALVPGPNTLAFLAVDQAGNQAVDTVTVTQDAGGGLPPDPSTVASPIEPNVTTTIGTATAFLYAGANPIQTGVLPGTIDPVRVGVLRGRVLDRQGQPVSGVKVDILGSPEYGQTLSRADGGYDLALNGGGVDNVRFTKAGYPEVQRRLSTSG